MYRNDEETVKGRVRHGVAVAFIAKGEKLTPEAKKEINDWVEFIFSG